MITQCTEKKVAFDYIGNDYGKCLYMYIDLIEYGLKYDFFNVWIQTDDNNNITAIISCYYDGFQIYSKESCFNATEIVDFITANDYSMIVGMEQTINKIIPIIKECQIVKGYVGAINNISIKPDQDAYRAAFDEINEIVDLVSQDEALGTPYGKELLLKQYKDRFNSSFGRSFILRNKTNNNIVAHAATYAETVETAVISGVITAPEYRGKGYSKGILAALCADLLAENKSVFSYYYIPAAIRMHHGVGFRDLGGWVKLVKINNSEH